MRHSPGRVARQRRMTTRRRAARQSRPTACGGSARQSSPRPVSGSNSVPTNAATDALGTEEMPACGEDAFDTPPELRFVAMLRQMVEGGQRVRLASTKLRRHIEDGGRLDLDARQAPKHLGGEVDQARREVRSGKEPCAGPCSPPVPAPRGCGRDAPRTRTRRVADSHASPRGA